jgi:hypothetical protein
MNDVQGFLGGLQVVDVRAPLLSVAGDLRSSPSVLPSDVDAVSASPLGLVDGSLSLSVYFPELEGGVETLDLLAK